MAGAENVDDLLLRPTVTSYQCQDVVKVHKILKIMISLSLSRQFLRIILLEMVVKRVSLVIVNNYRIPLKIVTNILARSIYKCTMYIHVHVYNSLASHTLLKGACNSNKNKQLFS